MQENLDQQKGASKKQLRIVELVKGQMGEDFKQEIKDELKEELTEEVETRLEKLDAKAGEAASEAADAPPIYRILNALRQPGFENDPEALRLLRQARGQGAQAELKVLGDLAELALRRLEQPRAKASGVILPSGGGLPAPDSASLRAEYDKRTGSLRPGDVAGLMELKREFRRKGLQVY